MAGTSTLLEERRARPPSHPGEILKADILPALDVTQEFLAECLGLSRKTVNEILGGLAPVRAETAIKLGALLGNSPMFWLNLQAAHDLWNAQADVPAAETVKLQALHQQFADTGRLD